METQPNILKNRDKASIDLVEQCFCTGALREAVATAPEIPRRKNLDVEEFDHEFRKKAKPVVIEGLMEDWPAIGKWDFEYLSSKCSDSKVVLDSYDSKRAREATFGEFVKLLKSQEPGSAPIYLQEWYYQASCPFLSGDLVELPIAQYDFRRNLYGEKISTNHQLWIGQKGAKTRLHQDSYLIDVMHAQISGSKQWCVMSPNASLTRDAAGVLSFEGLIDNPEVQILTCTLQPGDVVYLPALWWHRIVLLSDSIGLGRKCLDETNMREHLRMRLAELMALALNHDEVKKAHPELYKVVVLRNLTWAKLLDIDLSKLRP